MPIGVVAVPPGTTIENTAECSYFSKDTSLVVAGSNTVTLVTVPERSVSSIELLQYAPFNLEAEEVRVHTTYYSVSGTESGPFSRLPAPTPLGSTEPIQLT